jgi:O-antigen/teichoic acid export membrane protein
MCDVFFYRIKSLLKEFICYFLPIFFSKGINFFLLPIFTAYLSKEDFGIFGLVSSILAISSIYMGFKSSLYLLVKGSGSSDENKSQIVSNSAFLSFICYFPVLIILIIFNNYFLFNLSIFTLLGVATMALFISLRELVLTYFQIERMTTHYFFLSALTTIIGSILALLLIVVFDYGWAGRFYGELISCSIGVFVFLCLLIRTGKIKIALNFQKQQEIARYSFPLTFHLVGLTLMSSIDRFFLVDMEGASVAGVYFVTYTVCGLISHLHEVLMKIWSPRFFLAMKDENINFRSKVNIVKFTYAYFFFSSVLAFAFVFISPYIFDYMIESKFHSGLSYLPYIVIGLTFESFRKLFCSFLYKMNKNKTMAVLTLFCGLLNCLLNYLLVPTYGATGAAIATFLSYFCVFLLTAIYVIYIVDMPWVYNFANRKGEFSDKTNS